MSVDKKVSPHADFIAAWIWVAFGLAVLIGAWRMDRLESQGATLYTAPGLVPGLLGGVLLLLGLVLAWRAARAGGHRLRSLRWGVSEGTSGILDAARSATKMWRSARHSGVHIRLMKISRSTAMPSANFFLVAASTASTHLAGAG